jgi:7-cyano-7-deazaguanine synthase
MSKAVIVFSGGQDSTTCLGLALHFGYECHAIGFDYGQKHYVELEQARKIAEKLGVDYRVVNMYEFGKLVAGHTALVGSGQGRSVNDMTPLAHMEESVHASFVPNRNAVMLTIAHAYAQMVGADTVWTGVCETDYSGYPDCRDAFIKTLQIALNTGYQTYISILTPLMFKTKAETFKMAEEAGVLDLVIEESHTCYNGVRGNVDGLGNYTTAGRFDWGHGCGECPACKLRAKGWEDYKNLIQLPH